LGRRAPPAGLSGRWFHYQSPLRQRPGRRSCRCGYPGGRIRMAGANAYHRRRHPRLAGLLADRIHSYQRVEKRIHWSSYAGRHYSEYLAWEGSLYPALSACRRELASRPEEAAQAAPPPGGDPPVASQPEERAQAALLAEVNPEEDSQPEAHPSAAFQGEADWPVVNLQAPCLPVEPVPEQDGCVRKRLRRAKPLIG
jgi:hypothetical protein